MHLLYPKRRAITAPAQDAQAPMYTYIAELPSANKTKQLLLLAAHRNSQRMFPGPAVREVCVRKRCPSCVPSTSREAERPCNIYRTYCYSSILDGMTLVMLFCHTRPQPSKMHPIPLVTARCCVDYRRSRSLRIIRSRARSRD